MLVVKSYLVEEKEYMVIDATADFMPGSAAIRLLANYREGVGASRIILRCGSEAPTFVVYDADGTESSMTVTDYSVLARERATFEIHLTKHFVDRLRAADCARLARAC